MKVWTRRLLVVEDEPLAASLLARSLREAGFEVALAADVAQAREEIEAFDPDLILLDIALGDGPSGVHLAHAVARTRPDIGVLMLTQHSDPRLASGDGLGLPPGVGFLLKHQVNDLQALLEAIGKVLSNRASEVRHVAPGPAMGMDLTARSQAVLALVAAGYNNVEIARRTEVAPKTVERWIENLYRELGIDTRGPMNPRVQAARMYLIAQGGIDGKD